MANQNPKINIGQKNSLFKIYDTKQLFVLHLRENTKALLIRRWKTFLRLNQLNIIHTFLRLCPTSYTSLQYTAVYTK